LRKLLTQENTQFIKVLKYDRVFLVLNNIMVIYKIPISRDDKREE
jgi:hypothetical protein